MAKSSLLSRQLRGQTWLLNGKERNTIWPELKEKPEVQNNICSPITPMPLQLDPENPNSKKTQLNHYIGNNVSGLADPIILSRK